MLTHNAIMVAADRFGESIVTGALVSFCVVVVMGYLFHSRYTFAASVSWRGFVRYSAATGANVPLFIALTWAFTGPAGWPMAIGAPAATLAAVAVGYVASAWAISPARVRTSTGKRT